MNVKIKLLTIVGFCLMAAACTRENLDDCPTRVIVIADPEILETYPQRYVIERLSLYVFDGEGNFVTLRHGGAYIHGDSYVFDIDLDDGEHTFIAWTNLDDECYTPSHDFNDEEDSPTLDEMKAWLRVPQERLLNEDILELHYGRLENAEVVRGASQEFVVELIPDTYRINYTVKGLPLTEHTFSFTVTDDNSHYGFDNSIQPDMGEFRHVRHSAFEDDGNLYASMLSLKLEHDRAPWFCLSRITEAGDVELYPRDLVKMIQRAYELNGQTLDFSKIYEFDIVISFIATLDEFIITVNGWQHISQPESLE